VHDLLRPGANAIGVLLLLLLLLLLLSVTPPRARHIPDSHLWSLAADGSRPRRWLAWHGAGVWLGSGQYDSSWTHAWCSAKQGCRPELGLRLLLRATLVNGTQITLARTSTAPSTGSTTAVPTAGES
jgi:hypothetical protein